MSYYLTCNQIVSVFESTLQRRLVLRQYSSHTETKLMADFYHARKNNRLIV